MVKILFLTSHRYCFFFHYCDLEEGTKSAPRRGRSRRRSTLKQKEEKGEGNARETKEETRDAMEDEEELVEAEGKVVEAEPEKMETDEDIVKASATKVGLHNTFSILLPSYLRLIIFHPSIYLLPLYYISIFTEEVRNMDKVRQRRMTLPSKISRKGKMFVLC